jgi:acetyltransferase-like isoleucine patch superfamily enzyme
MGLTFGQKVRWLGYQSSKLDVVHDSRYEGKSSYNFSKAFGMALDLAISKSDKPLKVIIRLGFFIATLSVLVGFFYIGKFLLGEIKVETGFLSIILSIWFLSGVIIFILGILGLYLQRVFALTKNRPLYVESKCMISKLASIAANVKIGEGVKISDFVVIEENVEIGDNVSIGPFSVIRKGAKIGNNCKFTAYCEIREQCEVGDGSTMGSRCTISAGVKVGKNVTIKYGFVATDTPNLTEGDKKSVGIIGDNSLFGVNVVLMPGVNVGENCIIGACSQVRNDIPDHEIWYGNPAKFYKKND